MLCRTINTLDWGQIPDLEYDFEREFEELYAAFRNVDAFEKYASCVRTCVLLSEKHKK